jgi:ribonuclease BN (tRNA processing enzyme)
MAARERKDLPMRIRTLGCSGGIGAELRTTCLLVDDDILVDAGTGVGDLGLDELMRVRHVFLTHSHLDHVAGIPLMADTVFGHIDHSIVVHARPETIEALRAHIFNWVIWPDFSSLPAAGQPVLVFQPMRPGDGLVLGERRIRMLEAAHTVPAAGYHIEAGGRAFAFTGDTSTNDSLWAALNDCDALDVLIAESAFSDADLALCRQSRHYCPSLLAADLKKLRHRPRLYLTHLKPGCEDLIVAQCRAAIRDLPVRRLFAGASIQL